MERKFSVVVVSISTTLTSPRDDVQTNSLWDDCMGETLVCDQQWCAWMNSIFDVH